MAEATALLSRMTREAVDKETRGQGDKEKASRDSTGQKGINAS
jgi:hypothetical protein